MKKIIFYILCILTLLLAVFNSKKETAFNFPPTFNTMNIIVETTVNAPDDIILKTNDEFSQIPPSKNMLNKTLSIPVKTLDIYVKENFKNKIKSIVIFNDLNTHYFSDFSKFEMHKETICPAGNCSTYNVYKVPDFIKFNKNSEFFNYRYPLNTFCIKIFSLFRAFLPLFCLLFTIFYFIKNKIDMPKINGFFIFALILILGIAFRLNGLFDYLPWADECWSVEFSHPNSPILTAFSDPGNPPFFYLLLRLWLFMFGFSIYSMKLLPFILGILGILSIWFFLKQEFDLKIANTGAFLASINIPLIYYSGEMRSYILQTFLVPVITYFLFKILKEKKLKDFIIYGVLAAIISNAHYYGILFIVSNFLYGIFCLKNDKPALLKFFLVNLFAGISFLPFFIITAFKKALLTTNFNDWIPDINFKYIKHCLFYVFGGGISLFLSLISLFKYKTFTEKEKNTVFYLIFTIFFITFQAIVISYIMRPILTERYLIIVVPLILMYLAILFNAIKLKYGIILFIIWIIFMQNNTYQKNNRRKGIIDGPLIVSYEFCKQKPKNKNVYVITNLSSSKYLNVHKKYMVEDAKYISKIVTETEDTIKEIVKNDKNAIIFTAILDANQKNSNLPENYSCYFNSASDVCIWRIEN